MVVCCAEVGRSWVRGRVGVGLETALPILSSFYRSYEEMGRGGLLQWNQNWGTCFLSNSYLGLGGDIVGGGN